MSFDSAGSFLFTATQKYNLTRQAKAAMLRTRVNKFIVQNYKDQALHWKVTQFESGKLSIQVTSSAAASELFMRTHEILEGLAQIDLPEKIKEIQIQKN